MTQKTSEAATSPAPKVDSALVEALETAIGLLWEHCEGIAPRIEPLERTLAALSDRDVVLEGLLREARERLRAIQGACGDYLPPDSGISEHDLANTVIGLTDDRTYISLITRIDATLKGGVDEASPEPVGKNDGAMKWWVSKDDEWFPKGPFNTREDAIAEARVYAEEDELEGVFIAHAAVSPIRFPVDKIVEECYFENEDLFCYENGDEPGRLGDHEKADAELQALIDDWLEKYADTFVRPNRFARSTSEYYSLEDLG